jgi:signal peptidase II
MQPVVEGSIYSFPGSPYPDTVWCSPKADHTLPTLMASESIIVQPTSPAPTAPFANWQRWFWSAGVSTLVADLVSKQVIFAISNESLPPWIQHAYNPGVAWSLLADLPWLVVMLTVVLIPVLTVVWWRQYRLLGAWENLAFGAILGGALGNAVDRIGMQLGLVPGVRDFIHVDLGFPPLDPWPTFNLADSGICVGFAILVLLSFRKSP